MRRRLVAGLLLLFAAGCSEPPQKEIDQAQTALDAARTAGGEKYAAAEYAAASAALQKAHDSVDQRDYRQALNYAIDARQRAFDAARQAADGQAQAKRDIEALYGQAAVRATRLQTLLRSAEAAGAAPKPLRAVQATLRLARADLQKASAAISAGNYGEATTILEEVRGKLDAAIVAAQNIPQRPPRKRGR